MKLNKGQATRVSLLVLHQFGHVAMLVLFFVLFLFALFGFRLSRGPIEIPRLASWFATHFTGEGVAVHVGQAELAWAGYSKGGEVPFVLKLANIEVSTQSGAVLATVPEAVLSLPVVDLFGGRKPVTLNGQGATFPYSDVPVSWYAKFWPGTGFTLSHSDVHVEIGAGSIGKGQDAVAVQKAQFVLSVLHDGSVQVKSGQAQLAPKNGSAPQLAFSFIGHYASGWQGILNVQVDKVQAKSVSSFWPQDLLPITRQWITTHITSGYAQAGDFTFGLSADGNLSHLRINYLHGKFVGNDMSLIWLDGAPPLTNMNAVFSMQSLDAATITATSGNVGGVKLQNGSMEITGLTSENQSGLLKMNLSGSVQNVLAVLIVPPLNLLGNTLDDIKKATGKAQANLTVNVPFRENLKENELSFQVKAVLSNLRVPTPLPGVFFTNGEMSLRSDGHKLDATAHANLAGYPVNMTLEQDLSPDGSGRFTLSGKAGSVLWQALEKATPYISANGVAFFNFTISGNPTAQQQASLNLDLSSSSVSIPALGWAKPAGSPGRLDARFTLKGQQIVNIQRLEMQAPGLFIQGQSNGNIFELQQAQVGRNQISATLIVPSKQGMPWVLQGKGAVLDLRLQALTKQTHSKTKNTTKIPWQTNLTFSKVYTAPSPALPLLDVHVVARGVSEEINSLNFSAQGIRAYIEPAPRGLHSLTIHGDNAGNLLNIMNIYSGTSGGTLDMKATFGSGAVQGVLRLSDIKLVHAPGFMKVLQAATLYGVAQALAGPGLLLDRTTIPFTLNQNILTLHSADSYSEALGFTASGIINIASDTCNLETTIVPAYALNSFLGKIPLIGHLFTAEKGGGLLSMRAHITGKLNDPDVEVNPLSIFLPGFLRGIFGLGHPESKQ